MSDYEKALAELEVAKKRVEAAHEAELDEAAASLERWMRDHLPARFSLQAVVHRLGQRLCFVCGATIENIDKRCRWGPSAANGRCASCNVDD